MKHPLWRSGAEFASLLGMLIGLTSFGPQVAHAQLRETTTATRTTSAIRVVRTSGSADGVQSAPTSSPTTPLSLDQVKAYLSPIGLALSTSTAPSRVTPADPVTAGGRLSLAFIAANVFPADNKAELSVSGSYQKGLVNLTVRPAAVGEKLLIDCDVAPIPMRLKAPDGKDTETSSGHLVTIYDAPDLNEARFSIESTVSTKWSFHFCEVTKLMSTR